MLKKVQKYVKHVIVVIIVLVLEQLIVKIVPKDNLKILIMEIFVFKLVPQDLEMKKLVFVRNVIRSVLMAV